MVVGPERSGQETGMLFWKVLGSLLVALPLYGGMVIAFHLLNLPSNLAVVEGLCLLLLLAAGGFIAFRKIWRQS
jgi:hypothetical protein